VSLFQLRIKWPESPIYRDNPGNFPPPAIALVFPSSRRPLSSMLSRRRHGTSWTRAMQIIRCKRFRAIGWQESASVTPAKLFPNRGTYSNKRGNQTQHELGSNGRSCRSRGRCRGWGAGGRRARDSRGLDSSGCAGGRVGVLLGRRLCARRIVADIAVLGGRVLRAGRANEEKEEEAPQGGDGTKGSHFRWLWILIEAGKKRMNLENATRTDRQDGNGLGRLAPFLVLFEDTAERRRCARPQCPQAKSGLCYLRFPSGGFGSSSSHSSRLAPGFLAQEL